jgi:hypothetical protein
MIANDTAPEGAKNEMMQTVPLAALEIEGTAPAVGDEVSYTVAGKISRIEGEHAYVTAETINDQPATKPGKTGGEMSDDDMMAMARKADEEAAG